MVEFGFVNALSLAQTIGIVGTMVLTLYFSKRQIQSLSIHEQRRVLNDLDEKVHETSELMMERPSLLRVVDNVGYGTASESEQYIFSYYILLICSHAYAMRQRNVLNEAEWRTYAQWLRNCFRKGTISKKWKLIEEDKWFDPAFQNFINTQIVGGK